MELSREWKNRHALSALLVFLVASVFIAYLSLVKSNELPSTKLLLVLLWLLLVFSSFQNVYNTFMRERPEVLYYFYQYTRPEVFILVKIILTTLLSWLAALAALLLFVLILGLEVLYPWRLLAALFLGGFGLSSVLSLNAALAIKAGGNMTLMSILSFPLLTPILLFAVELSLKADSVLANTEQSIGVLLGLDVLCVLLAVVLFPFLWKE